jgi:hypothetical protein
LASGDYALATRHHRTPAAWFAHVVLVARLRIPETEGNRSRLLVGASAAGITMVTVGIGLVLFTGLE